MSGDLVFLQEELIQLALNLRGFDILHMQDRICRKITNKIQPDVVDTNRVENIHDEGRGASLV
jgi:hypothetical protein